MNIYVSPNNQKLLWRTMLKYPLFSNKYDKDIWFKTIIGQFYENNKSNANVSLKDINLHTVNYMIKRLQDDAAAAAAAPSIQNIIYPAERPDAGGAPGGGITLPNISQPAAPPAVPYTQQDFLNLRRNEFDSKLQKKENEHRELLQKPMPAEIDFRDKAPADGPIANIGELMKLEIEKRNRDIQTMFSPLPGVGASTPAAFSAPSPTAAQPPQPRAFDPPAVAQPASALKKSVSWKDEEPVITNEKLYNLYEKIASDLEYIKILLENKFSATTPPPKFPEIYNSSENVKDTESPLIKKEEEEKTAMEAEDKTPSPVEENVSIVESAVGETEVVLQSVPEPAPHAVADMNFYNPVETTPPAAPENDRRRRRSR